MDWNRAKTIFIITFLLLNIFLGYQLNEKRNASKINLLLEATLQEKLLENNIKISVELHDKEMTDTYISGVPYLDIEREIFATMKDQQVVEKNEDVVFVKLKDPYHLKIRDRIVEGVAIDFVNNKVVHGQEYRFSHIDELKGEIYFYQTYEGKKVDHFESGRFPLVLKFNENSKITSYEQSYLMIQPIRPQGGDQEIISSVKAIEILFNEQLIPSESEIHRVELNYFSFFNPLGEVQVFTPMWNIGVDEHNYYVNAIEGAVQNIK